MVREFVLLLLLTFLLVVSPVSCLKQTILPAGCQPVADYSPYLTNGVANMQTVLDAYLRSKVITNVDIPPVNLTIGLWFVPVYPNFYMYSLQNVDERTNTLDIAAALEFTWSVAPLGYYWADVPGLCTVTEYVLLDPRSTTWTPKLVPSNVINLKDYREIMESSALEISVDGWAKWTLPGNFDVMCTLIITDFPFDYQRCSVIVQQVAEIKYSALVLPYLTGACTTNYVGNSQWELIGTRQVVIVDSLGLSLFKAEFVYKRKPLFNLLSFVIPTVLLSFAGTTLFIVPADSEEKMMVAFSLLLTFFFVFSTVVSNLPPNSENMPVLYTYILVLFVISVVGSILAAMILHFSHCIELHEVEEQIAAVLDRTGLQRKVAVKKSGKVRPLGLDAVDISKIINRSEGARRSVVMSALFAPSHGDEEDDDKAIAKQKEADKKKQQYDAKVTKWAMLANRIGIYLHLLSVSAATLYYFSYVLNDWSKGAPVYNTDPTMNATFTMKGDIFFRSPPTTELCGVCKLNATSGQKLAGSVCSY